MKWSGTGWSARSETTGTTVGYGRRSVDTMTGPQRVVITGGATSIGLATAEKFLESGHRVHICDIWEE